MGALRHTERLMLCLALLLTAGMAAKTFLREGEVERSGGLSCLSGGVRQSEAAPPKDRPESMLPGERIDLNRADAWELSRLPGIDLKTGEKIVAYRERHGPFRWLKELKKVPDMKWEVVDRLEPYTTVESGAG